MPAAASTPPGPRVLMLVSEDWYFWSHRAALARAALARGCRVAVATRLGERTAEIRNAGIELFPLTQPRTFRRPWQDACAVARLATLYRTWRPDVVHAVSVKTGLLAAAASRLSHGPPTVLAFGGLGEVLSALNRPGIPGRLLRGVLAQVLRIPNSHVILQNPEDCRDLLSTRLVSQDRLSLIRGAGVCTTTFRPAAQPAAGVPRVLLASRMLWSKGVGEFVEAARILRSRGCHADFVLAGRVDPINRDHVPESQLRRWTSEGIVRWIGETAEIAEQLRASRVFCLPSKYGEGVPKALLEAAASGLPLVTTDGRGCREVCRDGENGIRIRPGDASGAAEAIARLLSDDRLRARYGSASRRIACGEFSEQSVIADTLAIYERMIGPGPLSSRLRPRAEAMQTAA